MTGTTAGPLVAGILADETGNYRLGFTILGILAALGSLFFAFATKPTPPSGQPVVADQITVPVTPATRGSQA